MKKLILFLFCSTFLTHTGMAQTVKYLSDGADLQAEHDAATTGDTFILGPGTYSGTTILSKQLTIIGPGYLNSAGPSGEAVITGPFSINAGSENSLITGLSFTDNVYLACSNLVFKRNTTTGFYFYVGRNSASGSAITMSNLEVSENFIRTNGGLFVYGNPLTNYIFRNNLIQGDMNLNTSTSSSGSFINNTFGTGTIASQGDGFSVPNSVSGVNVSFINNIFSKALSLASGNLFSSSNYVPVDFKYNVLINDDADFGTTPPANNSYANLVGDLFAGFPSNAAGLALDEQYILAPLSVAKDFGREAPYTDTDPTTDAGAFGGENPYVLSGIPTGPYIYKSMVPPVAATNSVVPVTVKAKSNN